MGHEQAQLLRRGPSDIAGLAATAGLGLLDRPLDRHHDVAEVDAGPGRARDSGADAPRANADGGSSGNDRTSVGPRLPMCAAFSAASSESSVRTSPIDAGDGASTSSSAAATVRASTAPATGDRTPSRTSQVDPPRRAVDRPGHDAGRSPPPPAAARRDSSSTTVFCGYAIRVWYMPSSCSTNAFLMRSRSRSVISHSSN